MSKLSITVRDFKPLHRNTLRGFATIRVNEMRLEIRDVAIHVKNDSRWAQLPAKPMLDRDGVVIRDRETGKITYAAIFEFTDRATRDAFSRAVVDAVLRAFPNAFEGGRNRGMMRAARAGKPPQGDKKTRAMGGRRAGR